LKENTLKDPENAAHNLVSGKVTKKALLNISQQIDISTEKRNKLKALFNYVK